MTTWSCTARPSRADVEERGKAVLEYMSSARLQCLAARGGEVLDHVTHEWREDGTLRSSASGRRSRCARTEDYRQEQ